MRTKNKSLTLKTVIVSLDLPQQMEVAQWSWFIGARSKVETESSLLTSDKTV